MTALRPRIWPNSPAGIDDPLDRAQVLDNLARNAAKANDQPGAIRYAEAAAAALNDAGFPDQESTPLGIVMARWVDSAASRRTGTAVGRLISENGRIAQGILGLRHAVLLSTDPPRARSTLDTLAHLNSALLEIVAQMDVAAAEIAEGLRRYFPDWPVPQHIEVPEHDTAMRLLDRINAVQDAAGASAEPTLGLVAEASEILAEAKMLGQPGLVSQACLSMAQLLRRRGEAAAADEVAEGESMLLPGGQRAETLVGRDDFWTFLLLRLVRLDAPARAGNWASVLSLATEAISAIEAGRYRIHDPFQQGGYLGERTRFYEMGGVRGVQGAVLGRSDRRDGPVPVPLGPAQPPRATA